MDLGHRANVFGVDLGLQQVKLIDLARFSTLLGRRQLGLGQVDAVAGLDLFSYAILFFLGSCLLLVEDLALFLSLAAVSKVL